MKLVFLTILFFFVCGFVNPTWAVSDPRLTPNNIFGINSLSPEPEMADIARLVNNKGDWGYVVIVIRKDERDLKRWQSFLNQAREHHLIPIIRLSSVMNEGGYWENPGDNDAQEWADFLSKLHFPTKNRYVQIYNEVNVSGEWGGKVDAQDYARELDKSIDAFKSKNEDFFILNAPLDLSRVTREDSLDAFEYFQQMEAAVPGIFQKLDGWASHSYPNPAFSAPPTQSGRISIDGYASELNQISPYLAGKDLPVFITETGWKRGDVGDLTEAEIASYYKEAFANVWDDKRIVVVAPFVFSYPEPLFDEFSFKKADDNSYYEHFFAIRDLPKVKGEPMRENLISGLSFDRPSFVFKDLNHLLSFKVKNEGNYVWDTNKGFSVKVTPVNASVGKTFWSKEVVYPGEEVEAYVKIKGLVKGTYPLSWKIVDNDQVLREGRSTLTIETPYSIFVKKIKALWPKDLQRNPKPN